MASTFSIHYTCLYFTRLLLLFEWLHFPTVALSSLDKHIVTFQPSDRNTLVYVITLQVKSTIPGCGFIGDGIGTTEQLIEVTDATVNDYSIMYVVPV